jgi:hypothetical protein
LGFDCKPGSRDFHPFQAIAVAVNKAYSLCKLVISPVAPCSSGLIPLANALQMHTTLQEVTWFDMCSHVQGDAPDFVLQALPACPHLGKVVLGKVVIKTKYASCDAMRSLMQLHAATELSLVLETDQWLAAADEIRRGRCNVQRLTLTLDAHPGLMPDATEAVKAVASAIRLDQSLEHLTLEVENGFTDEAGVTTLAEALTVNRTLRKITLLTRSYSYHDMYYLGVQAYDAFSAMLRVNTSLVLKLRIPFETDLCESREQMHIEQRLNQVGRGRLLASNLRRQESSGSMS